MTYDEVILEYAKMVQVYSPDGMRIYHMIEKKIRDYAFEENFNRRDYWKEVQGQFLNKNNYIDYERYRQLETIHKDLRNLFNIGTSKKSGTKTHEWINSLPKTESYVDNMADYRLKLDEEYLSTTDEAFCCTRDTLKFFYSALQIKTLTDKDFFSYIPLLIWGLENLFIYGLYSREFDNFILTNIIPLFRKHRIASNTFVDLISKEVPSEINLTYSTQFNTRNDYECPYYIIDNTSVSLDMFSNSLIYGFKNGAFKNVDLDNAKTIRRQNPLYSIYRFYNLAEQLNVEEETVYITSRKISANIYSSLLTQINTYNEENILFVLLSSLKEILSSEPGTNKRELVVWDSVAEQVLQSLDTLLEAQVLSTDKKMYVQEFLQDGRRRIQNELVEDNKT